MFGINLENMNNKKQPEKTLKIDPEVVRRNLEKINQRKAQEKLRENVAKEIKEARDKQGADFARKELSGEYAQEAIKKLEKHLAKSFPAEKLAKKEVPAEPDRLSIDEVVNKVININPTEKGNTEAEEDKKIVEDVSRALEQLVGKLDDKNKN
ncbi:MAG: hypothetical protein PHN74_00075 [Candidatus Pacebacteria bacterium]|nr:hypothetical protein [Candidatus Paceibacterota bacterium]